MLKWISLRLVVAMEKTESQIEIVGILVGGEDKFQLKRCSSHLSQATQG
jgi:hypothetical protein